MDHLKPIQLSPRADGSLLTPLPRPHAHDRGIFPGPLESCIGWRNVGKLAPGTAAKSGINVIR